MLFLCNCESMWHFWCILFWHQYVSTYKYIFLNNDTAACPVFCLFTTSSAFSLKLQFSLFTLFINLTSVLKIHNNNNASFAWLHSFRQYRKNAEFAQLLLSVGLKTCWISLKSQFPQWKVLCTQTYYYIYIFFCWFCEMNSTNQWLMQGKLLWA